MSVKVLLRLPTALHKKLRREAREDGISLNTWLIYKLTGNDPVLRKLLLSLPDFVQDFEGYVPGDHVLRLVERAGYEVEKAAWDVVRARSSRNGSSAGERQ